MSRENPARSISRNSQVSRPIHDQITQRFLAALTGPRTSLLLRQILEDTIRELRREAASHQSDNLLSTEAKNFLNDPDTQAYYDAWTRGETYSSLKASLSIQASKPIPERVEIEPDNVFKMAHQQKAQEYSTPTGQQLSRSRQVSSAPMHGSSPVSFRSTQVLVSLRSENLQQTKQISSYQEQLANLTANHMELQRQLHMDRTNYENDVIRRNRDMTRLQEANGMMEQELVKMKLQKQDLMKDPGIGYLLGLLLWKIVWAFGSWILGAFRWGYKELSKVGAVEESEELAEGEMGVVKDGGK